MTKELYINEIHKAYRIRNPKTFPTHHAKEIKKIDYAPIQTEEGSELKKIKVKSISDKKLTKITKTNIAEFKMAVTNPSAVKVGDYAFSCVCKVEVDE